MSGFDENPFGEPVFADPFKVSSRNAEKLPYFSIFSLFFIILSPWFTMIHLSYLGSVNSTSREKHGQQQSEPRRLRSLLESNSANSTATSDPPDVKPNAASVCRVGSAISSQRCYQSGGRNRGGSHTDQHCGITGESAAKLCIGIWNKFLQENF